MTERVALVTGAGRGIGLHIAAALAQRGVATYIGVRDLRRGYAVAAELAGDGSSVRCVRLDVTDDDSAALAAATIDDEVGRLDILVNNAGVLLDKAVPPSALTIDTLRATFETNVFGVVRVTNAMLPLLRRAGRGTIVNVSSAMGSLTLATTPSFEWYGLLQAAYNSSKSALNAITIQYAKELAGTGIVVNSVHPGVCATDLNGRIGERTAAEGARVIVDVATATHSRSGAFYSEGGMLPW
ncbi:MAG TPA: SDR family NAD(P)-dependent oxidoreductase [Vicinamibacterales bacterium]|nr:SDR family NAD(P)-dependent oxidoreductase [Vicinamibacterales bacterium]